jgi:hypothetical protein
VKAIVMWLVCRLRGHREVWHTLELTAESMTHQRGCLRCWGRFETVTRPTLVQVHGLGAPIYCYATGQTGPCGHALAGCPLACGDGFCPACGETLCPGCTEVRGRFSAMLDDAFQRLVVEQVEAPMPWADPGHDPLEDIRAHLRAIAEHPMAPPGQPTLVPKWLADELEGTGANVLAYPVEVPEVEQV